MSKDDKKVIQAALDHYVRHLASCARTTDPDCYYAMTVRIMQVHIAAEAFHALACEEDPQRAGSATP